MSLEFQYGTEMNTKNILHENINDLIKYFIPGLAGFKPTSFFFLLILLFFLFVFFKPGSFRGGVSSEKT